MTAVIERAPSGVDWPSDWGPAPRWATPRSPERPSFGPAVGRLAAKMGTPLFPWQQYIADVALEVDEAGDWVFDEVFVTAPRRSGKTHLIVPVTAHRCGQPGKATAWITAQTLKSAVRRWEEIADKIHASPFRSQVRKNRGNPQVLRWPATGSAFAPFAPNEDSMHGEDPDLVWVDELWAFDTEQRREIEQGYEPAFSVKSGQAWLMSTAGTPRSEWFNQVRRRGREQVEVGVRSGMAVFDWSAPERVGEVPIEKLSDDELLRVVWDAHPRRDHGLRFDFLKKQLGKGRIEFLRAYANLSQNEDSVRPDAVFDSERMRASRGAQIPDGVRVGVGVAVDEDRRDAAIAVAWRDMGGRAHTSYRQASGTRWAAGDVRYLVENSEVSVVAGQSAGPARDLLDELERSGVEVLRLSQPDTAAAGSRFHDEFEAGSVLWDGSVAFSAAVAAAEPYKVQSGIVWRSATGAPVSTLQAGTVAVWAVDHAPEPVRPAAPFRVR